MKRSRESEEDSALEPDSLDASSTEQPYFGRRPVPKITELDTAVLEDDEETGVDMKCFLPPHKEPLTFNSYEEYESHYRSYHTHRCLDCRKNFPSEHLLNVHIEECHDPLVIVKRDRGEHTYSCFVEGCERKCLTHQKRRMHLIDKHMYPKNYFFGITKDGIDGRRSLLNDGPHSRRRSSTSIPSKESRRRASLVGEQRSKPRGGETHLTREKGAEEKVDSADDTERPDTAMADLTGAMSALKFVPPSVRFGKGRAGFSKR
ncbi:hypothetical protein NLU13_3023 [Sarocladium strictum]|uniref:C2H2-type domain-containing protein n=1 Tax=Sarocladium strictum TaxID=5046 RepID=A0AA39L9X1_SARSR|nr:hypothetical protein NLU13_3023 [Sarocladium strictum]